MPARPVIGVTLELDDPLIVDVERNLRAPLTEAGALVLAVPRDTPPEDVPALLAKVDGVLLSGGEDVDPARYGEERHPAVRTAPAAHDAFEIALARAALEQGVPILGICRGCQVLAVADGGALVQDVPSQVTGEIGHRNDWQALATHDEGPHWHPIAVDPDSRLAGWVGDGPARVNSFHHQAVARTGARLRPVARAADGVIEAVEGDPQASFAVGLQWHDEFMWQSDPRWREPFAALVAAARRRG